MALPIVGSLTYSPTWYSANVLDTLEWNHDEKSGIFFYCARNSIYFIKVEESRNETKVINNKMNKNVCFHAKLHYFMKAHHEYVVGIRTIVDGVFMTFKKERKMPMLLSCGKDKMIRVWSFENDVGCSMLKEFNITNTKLFTNVLCISVNNSQTVLCGFEKGYLLSWNYITDNEWKIFNTDNDDILQIEWWDNKFAMGCKRGFVSVYIMGKYDTISKVTRFRAHQADICNISWNPIGNNADIWGDIVTASKDNRINIWRIDPNLNIKTLKLPSSNKKLSTDEVTSSNNSGWSSLCWSLFDHGTLIVSNAFGNLGIWRNSNDVELKCFSQNPHYKIHTKCVFGIKEFRNYQGLLVSHSLDRTINIVRIEDGGCVYSLPGLGGSAMSLAGSDHNNQLAVGCGDNNIRLWKYDSVNSRPYDVSNIWNGINGKVLSLSWHPYKEGLLAFGTEDGQVGIININKDKKVAMNSQLHHKSKVFVVTWGLDMRRDGVQSDENEDLIVYSIGNYSLFGHDFRRDDYFDASHLLSDGNVGISDICMHQSMLYVAVGYSNGLVNIFATKTRTLVCAIKTHSKGINCMRWNYLGNGDKLAIGSNERFLTITDLGIVFQNFTRLSDIYVPVEIIETVSMFKGHGDRITCVDWCPVDDDKLVTGSYDNTAFVWSIKINGPLASFNCHQGKLLCCHWCKRDPDLIYTGGDDSNLFSWRLSEQNLKSKFNKRRQNHDIPGVNLVNSKINDGVLDSEMKKDNLDNISESTISEKAVDVHIDQNKEVMKKSFVKKRTSLFPSTLFSCHHSLEEQQQSMLRFINNDTDHLACFTIFSSRAMIMKQIDMELEHHLKEGNLDNYFMILIWIGKIGRVIRECVSMSYTKDWLMTIVFGFMSRDVPESLIQTMVSNIVTNKKDPLLAATYWLSINDTKKAIDLLIAQQCVREALILAKLRLSPDHPLVKVDLVLKLQHIYFKNGSYELAAMCNLSLGNYKGFVETMNRRNCLLASWVTMKTLFKYQQQEIGQQCVMNFVNEILLENDMAAAKPWVDKMKADYDLCFFSIFIDIHRMIWVDCNNLSDAVSLIKDFCTKYDKEKIIVLQTQIEARLFGKQINQIENQLALYVTYALFVIIVRNIYDMSVADNVVKSLQECVEQLIKINGDCLLVKRLVAEAIPDEDAVMERLREHLSMLNIDM